MNRCASCGKAVIWIRTLAGKRMPLDATSGRWLRNAVVQLDAKIKGAATGPDSGFAAHDGMRYCGTFIEDEMEKTLFPITSSQVWAAGRCTIGDVVYVRVYKSHFATCPNASTHRRAA